MNSNLVYYCNFGSERKPTNLCGDKFADKKEFYLLPDKQMSFVKIIDFPPVSDKKLQDMVRFRIMKIYPGNTKDLIFDFIPFKSDLGLRTVIYILKTNYPDEIQNNIYFKRIILPLQLLSKKDLKTFSHLIVYYPDMVEVWTFTGGIPDKIERFDTISFSLSSSLNPLVSSSDPKNVMVIHSDDRFHETCMNYTNTVFRSFSQGMTRSGKRELYFPEYCRKKHDIITPLVSILVFICSCILFISTLIEQKEFEKVEDRLSPYIESVRSTAAQNLEKLNKIESLRKELEELRGIKSINIYELLLRIDKATDSNTVVLFFGIKERELTLSLKSRSALSNLENYKKEFGNVRSSDIRTNTEGTESYTIWVEI